MKIKSKKRSNTKSSESSYQVLPNNFVYLDQNREIVLFKKISIVFFEFFVLDFIAFIFIL